MSEFLTIILALAVLFGASWAFKKMVEAQGCAFAGSALLSAVILVPVALLMFHLQSDGQYTYHQFFNGTETAVVKTVNLCDTDSGCTYTYTRSVSYQDCETTRDSKGNSHTSCTTKYHYYDDPLFAEEDTWTIQSTIGDFVVTDHAIPTNWRPGVAFTQYGEVSYQDIMQVVRDHGTGEPQEARVAEQAIRSGMPRAATMLSSYSNPINGSGATTATSDQIDQFQKLGVLPKINEDVFALDQSNKVLFAGIKPPASVYARYQQDVGLLNEEAGSLNPPTRRFDIQIVMVSSNKVPYALSRVYANALDAYWQSSQFGHSTLPKNMAVIVLGTDGQKVTWGFGFTLIDIANNQLWNLIAVDTPGASTNPDTLLGTPHTALSNGKLVRVVASSGVLERLIFDPTNGFARSHITDKHAGSVGFDWMMGGPPFWFCLIVFLIIVLVGAVISFLTYALTSRTN